MPESMLLPSALIILGVFVIVYGAVVLYDIQKAKKRGTKYHFRQALTAFLLLLPATALAYFFILLPIVYSLGYAFTNYRILRKNTVIEWVGFQNFQDAFEEIADHGWLFHAVKNTALFVVLVVPIQILLALAMALFCNVKAKGNGFFKVCFFIPVAVSLAVTSFLWAELLSPSKTGFMNSILGLFGLPPQDFINNPSMTMIWIVIISAWQGAGYQMLIFLSGLTGIKKELYEAARLDGCNAFQRFLRVTLPGLKPTLVYVLITVFIGACRIMVQPMLMVGFQENSVTLSYYMYQMGFSRKLAGYSSAIALLMTIFIGAITLIQRKLLGGKRDER